MRTSTLTLSILLAGAVGYAAFLQLEVSRLKEQVAIIAAPTPGRSDTISEKEKAGVSLADEAGIGAVASEADRGTRAGRAPRPIHAGERRRVWWVAPLGAHCAAGLLGEQPAP